MPTDVPVEFAVERLEAHPVRRLPIGLGLGIGACASVALWTFIGLGLRALLA